MAWRSWLLIVCIGIIPLQADPAQGRERWDRYRDGLLSEPGLVRLYAFEGVTDAQSPVPDLTGAGEPLKYVPNKSKDGPPVDDMTVIPGRWNGKSAVSVDQAYYEAPPVEATTRGFSAECWFREHGAGTLQPRGPNGTLLSVSTGYYDGWRITLAMIRGLVSRGLISMLKCRCAVFRAGRDLWPDGVLIWTQFPAAGSTK